MKQHLRFTSAGRIIIIRLVKLAAAMIVTGYIVYSLVIVLAFIRAVTDRPSMMI